MAGDEVDGRLFDRIVVVDWSAANARARGANSIWIADSHASTLNPATRSEAMERVENLIADSRLRGERVLIGFDFSFGYPAGFADAIGVEGWTGVWSFLHNHIEDDDLNRSNRWEVAARINRELGPPDGPFWGYKNAPDFPRGLHPEKHRSWDYGFDYLRHVERRLHSASPVFKLAYTGSVGSQALLGIARLEGLRRRFPHELAIWPFETDFGADLTKPVIIAEIYPSAHAVPDGPEVTDQRQVEAVLRDFLRWDIDGMLREKLDAPELTGVARDAVRTEEGWVVGL